MGYYSDTDKDLIIYFKNKVKPVEVIKIFIGNGWKVNENIKYVYEVDSYTSESYFDDDIKVNIPFKGDGSDFYKKLQKVFDEYGAIELILYPNNIVKEYMCFSFFKKKKHLKYFKWGEEHPINEYDYSTIYDYYDMFVTDEMIQKIQKNLE